jgi:hypothetical protein
MNISIPKIEQYLPILLLITYLLFPSEFILQSNTILGKLFSILVIVIYTNVNYLYGLVVCLLVIFYYQSDYIYNVIQYENFQPSQMQIQIPYLNDDIKESMISQINSTTIDNHKIENIGLLELNKAYSKEKLPIQSESETIFRNQHCNENLELIYKKQIIHNNDKIPNIFPDIQFVDNNKPCNPCDPHCPFVIKSSLEKKDRIGQSTRGKTSLEEAMDWAYSFFVNKNEPFSGVDLNVASYL